MRWLWGLFGCKEKYVDFVSQVSGVTLLGNISYFTHEDILLFRLWYADICFYGYCLMSVHLLGGVPLQKHHLAFSSGGWKRIFNSTISLANGFTCCVFGRRLKNYSINPSGEVLLTLQRYINIGMIYHVRSFIINSYFLIIT